MIEVKSVSKTFLSRDKTEVHALAGVDLTIRDNEFLTLLGPSGCGKTTLLRNIAGLESMDSGSIQIDGEPVVGPGRDRAMVFQGVALLPWLTVCDNVAFGLRLRSTPKKVRDEEARRLIKLVGLAGFEEKLPGELSGGMQQRVGLARALAVQPRVLLMDEPFGALDEQTRRILQEELLRIWETARTTVVFVTHSIDEAVLLGDRIVVMSPRPGKIDEIVDVPLSRPRSGDIESLERSEQWTALRSRLWTKLRGLQTDLAPSTAAGGA